MLISLFQTRLIVEYTTTQEEHVTLTLKVKGVAMLVVNDFRSQHLLTIHHTNGNGKTLEGLTSFEWS